MHKLQHTYTPNETTSRVIKIYVFYYSVSFYCAFTANEVLLSGFLLINVLFLNVIPRFLCCMRRDERRFFFIQWNNFRCILVFFSPFRLNCTFAWCCILFGLLLHFETLKHKTSTCTYCTTLLTISFSLVNTKINYLVHVWHSYKFCNATLTMVPLIHTYAHTLT